MTGRRWMMVGAAAVMMPFAAEATPERCTIFYHHDKQVEEAIGESEYAFDGFDTLCRFLKQRNLRVVIAGDSGVLSNRSYGWAYVKVADRRTLIESAGSTFSTSLDVDASSPAALARLRSATNNALHVLATNPRHLTQMADEVVAETERLRRVLGVAAPAVASAVGPR